MSIQQQWQSQTESPRYQQAGDAEREAMRTEFFDTRIAPDFYPADRARAKEMFDQYTAPQGNPNAGVFSDTFNLAVAGLKGAAADVAQGATLGHQNFVADLLRESSQENMEDVSPSMLEAIENTGFDYDAENGLSIRDDSSFQGWYGHTIQGAGSMPVSIGVGGLYGKIAGKALGAVAGKSYQQAVRANNFKRAKQIMDRVPTATNVGRTAGYSGMGAQMMVGGVASQAYDDIKNMPAEERRQLEPFQEKMQEATELYPDDPAMAEAHATDALAKDVSLHGRGMAALIGAVTGNISNPLEARMLLGKGATSRLGNAFRGGMAEITEEGAQSGSSKYLSNKAQIEVAQRDLDVMDGVIGEALTSAVAGGVSGAALGGASRPATPVTKDQVSAQIKTTQNTITSLESELRKGVKDETVRDQKELELGKSYQLMKQLGKELEKAPTQEQLARTKKGKPAPASDNNDYRPLDTSNRNWIYPDLDDRLRKANNNLRKIQSEYTRAIKNGGAPAIAEAYESQLKKQNELIGTYTTLRDNRQNQQYFESQEQFDDWISRLQQGGDETRLATNELSLRKSGTALKEGMMNVRRQVDVQQEPVSHTMPKQGMATDFLSQQQQHDQQLKQKKAQHKEQHIVEQEQKWQQLQEEMEQKNQQRKQQEARQAKERQDREESKARHQGPVVIKGMLERKPKTEDTSHKPDTWQKEQEAAQAEKERKKEQQQIDKIHFKQQSIGRYGVWPSGKDQFAVSNVSPAESGAMNNLGGHRDESGAWFFPRSKRLDVLAELESMSTAPRKTRVGEHTPKRKQKRKAQAALEEGRRNYQPEPKQESAPKQAPEKKAEPTRKQTRKEKAKQELQRRAESGWVPGSLKQLMDAERKRKGKQDRKRQRRQVLKTIERITGEKGRTALNELMLRNYRDRAEQQAQVDASEPPAPAPKPEPEPEPKPEPADNQPDTVKAGDPNNRQPARGWKDHNSIARDFAKSVGIDTQGRSKGDIIRDIDQFLKTQQEEQDIQQKAPEQPAETQTSVEPDKTSIAKPVSTVSAQSDFDPASFSNVEGDLSTLTKDNLQAISDSQKHGIKSIMQRIGSFSFHDVDKAFANIQKHLDRYKKIPDSVKQTLRKKLDGDHYDDQIKLVDLSDDEKTTLRKVVPEAWFDKGRHTINLKYIAAEVKADTRLEGGNDVLETSRQPEKTPPDQTPSGKEPAEVAGSGDVDTTSAVIKEAVAEAKSFHKHINQLADFFRSLPASTLNHFPTLAKALKAAPIGERFRFEKNNHGVLTLKDRKTGRRLIPPAFVKSDEDYDYLMHQISAYADSDQPLINDTYADVDRFNSSKKQAEAKLFDSVPASESFVKPDTDLMPDVSRLKNLNKGLEESPSEIQSLVNGAVKTLEGMAKLHGKNSLIPSNRSAFDYARDIVETMGFGELRDKIKNTTIAGSESYISAFKTLMRVKERIKDGTLKTSDLDWSAVPVEGVNEAKPGATNETGRKSSNEPLEGTPASEVSDAEGTRPTEAGSGDSGRAGSRADGAVDQQRTDTPAGERDSAEGADLRGAGTTSESDLQQRTGGINSGAADFTIDSTIAEDIAGGGKKSFNETQRFNDNIAAIKLIKELGDRPATAEQQEILAKYVGWGGLQTAFPNEQGKVGKGWKDNAKLLKDILTDDEYQAAISSTRNAHYTTPAIVNAIYAANQRFGAHHGRILEPSVGVGNFIGLMPPDMRGNSTISAVELDVISGMIASKLYPSAKIHTPMAFQDFDLANNSYDIAVANPPFGGDTISDAKRKDISGWKIHNYFMAKTMDALRPGGVMSVVVSKGWMDSKDNQQGRDRMFRDAKLVGAFRLPSSAFKANANTDVTTDLIFLQKREQPLTDEQLKTPPATEVDYRNTAAFTGADGSDMKINQHFVSSPDQMLGDAVTNMTGQYGAGPRMVLEARKGLDWQQALNEGINHLPQRIFNPEYNVSVDLKPDTSLDIHQADVGGLYLSDTSKLMRRDPDVEGEQYGLPVTGYTNSKGEFISYKGGDIDKLNQLLPMARTARELIRRQVTEATDQELQPLRDQLSQQYDDFVKKNKALSRDANKRLLYNSDPSIAPMLLALESQYDKEITKSVAEKTGQQPRKEQATKADIFTRRTQSPYSEPKSADSGQAGLTISLSQTGKVDMAKISDLTGKTEKQLYQELKGQIYYDPKSGWQTKDAYLSGNVKEKLRQAQEMVAQGHFDDLGNKIGTDFKENIAALEKVIPKDVPANKITVRMGAVWQSPEVIQDFWRHLMDAGSTFTFVPQTNKWFVDARSPRADLMEQWGSDGAPASWLIDRMLNNKQIIVTRKDSDGKTFTDKKATEAANIKAEEIQTEFESWLWQDPQRRQQLEKQYNDVMNTTVDRSFDGSHLSFPGKVSDDILEFYSTQVNAIWRTLQNPATLLDHVVGAGKTFTMIGSAMEMRRMGLAKKPTFVVPNHLVEQWASDFAVLYPNAKVLAASKEDFTAKKRKQLFARIATGDWDAVIVSHSSFGKLPSDPVAEQAFIEQQLKDLIDSEKAVREAEGKDARSTKELQKARDRMKEKLKQLVENTDKDTGLNFQELGIDALFLDEAHEFKNLEFQTSLNRVKNINPNGAAKAADMFVKTQSVSSRGGKLVFATGTPISNSMAEMYTMQRYLGYEALKKQGLAHFDAWAKQFGSIETKLERKPSGKYEPESRFAKFINLPELMQQSRVFSDVLNNDDIIAALAKKGKGKHVPNIKGGRPANTVADRSLFQEGYMAMIEHRFANMPDDARKDNPLKATNDARKAALDMRMIYPDLPDFAGSKLNKSVDNMMDNYHQWSDDKGTQLIFCDLSTPKGKSTDKAIKDFRDKLSGLTDNTFLKNRIKNTDPADLYDLLLEMSGDDRVDADRALRLVEKTNPDEINSLGAKFDVYNDVKKKLIAKGVPASEIAFIHDASNDKQKAELFDAVKTGKVRFLLGSTAKMGAGTNVQDRLVALHHLDAPWRPSDLEQREGRIIRQGNQLYIRDPQNFEVEIHRYATEQTYDVNMWQTLEIKANFIEQVRHGDPELREAQDIGGEAASAADMKAASSGDPRILEQVEIQRRLSTLQNQKRTHQSDQLNIGMALEVKQRQHQQLQKQMQALEADKNRIQPVPVDSKGKPVPAYQDSSGNTFKTAKEAIAAFASQINNHQASMTDQPMTIGSFRGFEVKAQISPYQGDNYLDVWLAGDREYRVYKDHNDRAEGDNYNLSGAITRLSNAVGRIENDINDTKLDLERVPKEIKGLKEQHGQPFKYAEEYEQKKVRSQQLLEELGASDTANEAAQALPQYDQLQQEQQYYQMAVDGAVDDANKLIHQVQLSRVNRLMERLRFAPEGKESAIANTVDAELDKIKTQTSDLRDYAQVAGRYRLSNQPAKRNYQTKAIASQLQKQLSDVATVVQHESDLPQHLRDQIRQDGVEGRVKGVYDEATGDVYVIASAAENVRDGLTTALHEAVGHKGLRNLLGNELNPVLDQIYQSLSPEQKRQMREQYIDQIAGKQTDEQRRIIAEEHLAHLAETSPRNNFLQQALARVRQWLRKHFQNLKYSNNDMRQLIMQARKQAQQPVSDRVKPAKMDTPQAIRYKVDKFSQMDNKAMMAAAGRNYDSFKEKVLSSGALGTLGGRQITRVFGRVFEPLTKDGGTNPLTTIGHLTQDMSALRGQWTYDAEKVDNLWAKLAGDKWSYQQTNDLMYDSTLAGIDPRWTTYQAKHGDLSDLNQQLSDAKAKGSGKRITALQGMIREEQKRRQEYSRLKEKYSLLKQKNELATDVFDQVAKYYEEQFEATVKAMDDRLAGMKLDPNAKGQVKAEIDALFKRAKVDGVYFPLMRFGDFAVIAQTPDGKEYREHFESKKDMQLGRAELESQGYKILSTGKNRKVSAGQLGGVSEFSGKILKALQSDTMNNIDADAKTKFMDEVHQISLAMLPELSAAKRSMHRKKVAGFDTNARRSFNSVAIHGANRLSRIEYGWRIDSELNRMDDAVDERNADSPLSEDDRIAGHAVAEEMRKRHELNMNPKGNALSAFIVNSTFTMYMGASLGAGLVNITQNFLVGLPVLAGQYGFRKSFKVLMSSMKDYAVNGRQKLDGVNGVLNDPWLSLHNKKANSQVSADEIAIIKALIEDGTIETSPAHALADRAGSDIQPESQVKRDWMQKLVKGSGMFFHNAEVFNRQLIALTALRLYKEKHGLDVNNKEQMAKAQEYVRDQVLDSHFDYSSYNRPRHFKGNAAKVMLIFKQYSQNMTFHLVNAWRESFDKNATQEQQKAARKVLMTTLGMHFAFAGALGMPAMSMLMNALTLAFGDEDDPKDLEVEMRNNFSDVLGPTLGHIFAKGLFNGVFNIDMHARTKLDGMWMSDAGYEMSPRQKGMHYFTSLAGGPAVSQAINMFAGANEIAQGDTMRGVQRLLPKAARDVLRAYDYSVNGIVDSKGHVLKDDYSLGEAVLKSTGISPASESEVWSARGALSGQRNALTKRRNDLLRMLDRAYRNDNQKDFDRIVKQIKRFNSIHQDNEATKWSVIPDKTWKRSLKNREKSRERSIFGVDLSGPRMGMTEYTRGYVN